MSQQPVLQPTNDAALSDGKTPGSGGTPQKEGGSACAAGDQEDTNRQMIAIDTAKETKKIGSAEKAAKSIDE